MGPDATLRAAKVFRKYDWDDSGTIEQEELCAALPKALDITLAEGNKKNEAAMKMSHTEIMNHRGTCAIRNLACTKCHGSQ